VRSLSAVRGGAPTAQKFSTIFNTQDGISRHIVNCGLLCSHLGDKTPVPLAYAPVSDGAALQEIAPSFWSAPLSGTLAPAGELPVFSAIPKNAPIRFGHVSFCSERFLPRDAMRKRGNSSRPVSVRLSPSCVVSKRLWTATNCFLCYVAPSIFLDY